VIYQANHFPNSF